MVDLSCRALYNMFVIVIFIYLSFTHSSFMQVHGTSCPSSLSLSNMSVWVS